MEQGQDNLANLQLHIRELEEEIVLIKKAANRIRARKGEPPLYNEAELTESGSITAMRSDQFYGKPLFTAMKEFLVMRRRANLGPATVNEIYEALARGQMKFDSEDVTNRKRNIRISLSKNSSIFHRMPDGSHFGLREWYADIKNDEEAAKPKRAPKKRARAVKVAGKAAKANATLSKSETPAQQRAATLMEAIQLGIEAQTGEFTKQDVLDWITKNHPTLGAKKESVFTSINRFKKSHGIKTVKEGKGPEPHVFKRETVSAN
jgi:hypothetical protein